MDNNKKINSSQTKNTQPKFTVLSLLKSIFKLFLFLIASAEPIKPRSDMSRCYPDGTPYPGEVFEKARQNHDANRINF